MQNLDQARVIADVNQAKSYIEKKEETHRLVHVFRANLRLSLGLLKKKPSPAAPCTGARPAQLPENLAYLDNISFKKPMGLLYFIHRNFIILT